MKNQKNTKEWQSVLLWRLMISGLLFFVFQSIFYLRFPVDWANILLLIFMSLVCLGGIISNIAYCRGKRGNNSNRFTLIRRPILIFFLSYFLFGVFYAVLDMMSGSIGSSMIKGSFIHKVMVFMKEGFSISNIFIGIPFIVGYLTGFFIYYALKIYRKYFRHLKV